ncbi:uncharacterized protein N7482_010035 [Penicillium canariense]|uniref:Uncharacterized protein n=1 Tax=Penicillium canariense TaxID=189055 RepID=A0A9W9HQN9_9EURO|nr:uncharacterized protein N7482_010035 [Penicillium canariense]KAJ5153557.1 hypothetical protein N7482_010035 [Penicillium canariense]
MASANPRRPLLPLPLFLAAQTCSAVNSIDCNSNNTPIFDLSSPKYFQLSYQPKSNTSVAGASYYETGADAKTAASFWYIDFNDDIINSYQQCSLATGEFVSSGVDELISAGMPKPAKDTSLSVVLVGASEDHRIYYHDTDKNLQQILYNPSF